MLSSYKTPNVFVDKIKTTATRKVFVDKNRSGRTELGIGSDTGTPTMAPSRPPADTAGLPTLHRRACTHTYPPSHLHMSHDSHH